MSDANRTQLGVIRESVSNQTPSNPAFQVIRTTGTPGLGLTPNTVVSAEIRADRQIPDLILVGIEIGGSVESELSFESHDLLAEGALQSLYSTKPTVINTAADTEITAVTDATDTFTVDTGLGTPFVAGMLIRTTGFTNSNNNLIFRVASSTSTTIVGSSLTLTDEAAPPSAATIRVIGFEGASADIDATATGLSSTALDFTTLGLAVGDWVKIGGTGATFRFVTAANNGWARISSISANALDFDVLPTGWSTETGTGLQIRVFTGEHLRNGTTLHSYTIEQQFQDHSPVTYNRTRGQSVDTLSYSIEAQSIVTASYGFIGRSGEINETAISGATSVSPTTTAVLNSSSNVGSIREGGTEITGPNYVLSATIEIANNLRAQNAVGFISNIGVGSGQFGVTGTLSTYFNNDDLVQKVINNERTSFDMRFTDSDDHALIVDLPRMKFSSGSPEVSGANTDVTAEIGFQAFRHETLGYTMQLQRFHYFEV